MDTVTFISDKKQSEKRRSEEKNLSLLEALFYPFIKVNFALSIKLNQWREDRFSSLASSLTCWQAFFFSGASALWLLPPIKKKEDIYWASSVLIFLFFCTLFGMHKWVMFIIYKSKIGSRISKKRNLNKLRTVSLLLTILLFTGFSLTIILKAYWYHTRFFWWNH
jgi:hypothetical protein